jgi:formate/nitrite transporter FocA (FNT family)
MANQDGKPGQPALVEPASEHEPLKTAPSILKQEIKQGLEETRRPAAGLLVSAIAAGLELGFSLLVIATLLTLDGGTLHPVAREVLFAGAYALGFILVILGKSQLFTEHTSLAVFPFLNGDSTLGELLRLWVLVLAGNLIGALIFAFTLAHVGPGLGLVEPSVLGEVARRASGHSSLMLLLSGILAGWLMGLLSWLVTAARDTVGQILIILLVTGIIGFAHLHHSVAGSIEVLTGLFAGQGVTWADFGRFLLWATLGNIIGGVLLVALVKYGHSARSGAAPESVEVKA